MPAKMDSLSLLHALLAETRSSIEQTQAAIGNGQALDLCGLEKAMARLCAQALELPPALRPHARAELLALQQPIERLFETLAGRVP
jgi:hypothetical protein